MRNGNKAIKKIIALALSVLVLSGSVFCVNAEKEGSLDDIKTVLSDTVSETAYLNYYNEYSKYEHPLTSVKISPSFTNTSVDGIGAIVLGESGNFVAQFSIATTGVYYLNITYRTFEGDSSLITTSVKLDGKHPFDEAASMELPRLYTDDLSDGKFKTDKFDNDIRPASKEIYTFQTKSFSDTFSLYSQPYIFYLAAGVHCIEIASENKIAVANAEFYNSQPQISYNEYIKNYRQDLSGDSIRQEAELIYTKSSDNIYPTYEKTDASTFPRSAVGIKLNTIGKNNWSGQCQQISWKANVKKPGLYSISFRVNQSYNENGSSYRKLLINGEVPFKEAECIEFPYSVNWYIKTLGDKEPYYVYLEPDDIITLEVALDKTADISRSISSCLTDLSSVYRKIFVITGVNPDAYVDYNLDVKIPTLMKELKTIKKNIEMTIDLIVKVSGKRTSAASSLAEILETVSEMIEKPYDIHRHVGDLSDDITNMGSLVTSVGKQPLELDCFYITPCNSEIPSGKVSFFDKVKYGIERFLYSYASTYGSLDGDSSSLKVWISTGRDQLSIIQQMIEEEFESKHDVDIELSLVDTGATLLKATISGKGPDVALTIEKGTPINLAIRGALVDLTKYDLTNLNKQFYEESWTPYRFGDKIYAIPETQTFDMIFYRTDIFEMLGLKVPETWEEFYEVLEVLQRSNYEIGIPEIGANAGLSVGISTFNKFLLQRGGTYYTEDYRKTAFDTDAAYSAFSDWVSLYKKYSLDRSFDFFNRFRTGVMAMSIQSYSLYNQLYAAAPEIRGLWAMAPIPGTVMQDGSINRAEDSGGAGCIMLKSSVEKGLGDEAFAFMEWWCDSKAQLRYANELEATMGIAARYTPANKITLENMGWKPAEISDLTFQMEQVINFREIPGSYVLPRSLTSAFRKALVSSDLPERQLELYNKDINAELERKAKEFELY